MKISKATLNIFKNFASINNAICIDEEKCIKTLSTSENIIGVFDTEETFSEFAIYNLSEFLGITTLFDIEKTAFEFDDTFVKIKSGKNQVKYYFTDKDLIPNVEKIKSSDAYKAYDKFDCQFELSSVEFSKIQKASQIMRMNDLSIEIEDGNVSLTLSDKSNPVSNTFDVSMDGQDTGKISLDVNNLMLIPGDYLIHVSTDKIAKFSHKDLPLFYFISAIID